MNADQRRLDQITERIIGCFFAVANDLGCGFLEKVYENSVAVDLRAAGLHVQQQAPIIVRYRGQIVGEYIADLLVEGEVIVEVKAVQGLDDIHRAQCLNYLKATGLRVCLLANFGRPKVEFKRIVRGF